MDATGTGSATVREADEAETALPEDAEAAPEANPVIVEVTRPMIAHPCRLPEDAENAVATAAVVAASFRNTT